MADALTPEMIARVEEAANGAHIDGDYALCDALQVLLAAAQERDSLRAQLAARDFWKGEAETAQRQLRDQERNREAAEKRLVAKHVEVSAERDLALADARRLREIVNYCEREIEAAYQDKENVLSDAAHAGITEVRDGLVRRLKELERAAPSGSGEKASDTVKFTEAEVREIAQALETGSQGIEDMAAAMLGAFADTLKSIPASGDPSASGATEGKDWFTKEAEAVKRDIKTLPDWLQRDPVPARGEEPPVGQPNEVDALKAGIKDAIDTLTMPMPVYSGNVKVDDWSHRRDRVKDALTELLAGTPQGEA